MKDYNIYIIDEKHSGRSIKDFLINYLSISHRNLVKLKRNSSIFLNGESVYVTRRLEKGDKLEILLSDEESENVMPEEGDLDIVYEDDYLIVVNKKPNMPVHPSKHYFTGTLANILAHYYISRGRHTKIRPINRLDKNTSGLVLFAKNSHIQYLMSKKEFNILKKYIAVAEGLILKDKDIIDLPIKRESYETIKRIVSQDGQRAITQYEVIKKNERATLLSIDLITGRTHQIRVHMSHLGHPLFGDELYGGKSEIIQRQALHAERLVFKHPIKRMEMELFAEVPHDIRCLCHKLML